MNKSIRSTVSPWFPLWYQLGWGTYWCWWMFGRYYQW